jgi:WD40 repeat protein
VINFCVKLLERSAVGLALAVFAVSTSARAEQAARNNAALVIQCGSGPKERPTVVTGVAITPDGRMIAAATDDHHVSMWDSTSGELKGEMEGHADWVHSVVLSRDGATMASGAGDRSVCLWNVTQQQPVFQIPACKNNVASVSLHPHEGRLAVVGFTKGLEIINTETGQTAQELDGPCMDIRTVVFSPQGDLMAAGGRNGKIRVWNVRDGSGARDIDTGGRRIRALAFSPDGSRIAAAGNGQSIEIFDAMTGERIMTLATRPAKVYSLIFLDSQHLATGGSDNRVTTWDLDSKQADLRLEGHTGTVAALACDSTGKILVSGSYDTTLRVWNLGERQGTSTAWRGKAGESR